MTRLKKINGRKRHILVDNNGFLLKCYIGPANENDRTGAIKLFANTAVNIKRVYADMGYTGHKLRDYILNNYQIELEVIKRPRKYYYALPDAPPLYMESEFKLLPKRWIVERTFAWLGRSRRLSKEYEGSIEVSQNLVYLAMCKLMCKRLAK